MAPRTGSRIRAYKETSDRIRCKACGECLSRCPVPGLDKAEAAGELRRLVDGADLFGTSFACIEFAVLFGLAIRVSHGFGRQRDALALTGTHEGGPQGLMVVAGLVLRRPFPKRVFTPARNPCERWVPGHGENCCITCSPRPRK